MKTTYWTKIRISCYKPEGWEDTYYVRTKDRGLAIRTVLAAVGMDAECVNYIEATYRVPNSPNERPARTDHILEPISG